MKANESELPQSFDLTGKQGAVLAMLVGGATIEGAAKANSVRPATVHGWMKKPEFRGAYKDALGDVINHASGQLKSACSVAVATLREIAEDTEAPSAPRVSAARAIIELSQRAIEQEEIIARIEALEELNQ